MEIIDLCRSKLLFQIRELSQESHEKTFYFVGQERKKEGRKKERMKEKMKNT